MLGVFIERTIADSKSLLVVLINFTKSLSPDLFTETVSFLADFTKAVPDTGNHFLAHFWGGVCGAFYSKPIKSKMHQLWAKIRMEASLKEESTS